MRSLSFGVSLLFVLLAAPVAGAERVEYGKREELANVVKVFVAAEGNVELAAEARVHLAGKLPALVFAERENDGDVTLRLARQLTEDAAAGTHVVVTTARATRQVRGTTRLYFDAASRQEDIALAALEVLTPFVDILRAANPERFGDANAPRKASVHSTEGLKPGMSKRDVLLAIGRPHKRDKGHAFTETWMYATTHGTMRLVFGGDRLQSIVFEKKK
ncbi:MAG: hypothetical protein ACYC7A_13220 [Thermoanaerobaculia bacterium]